MTAAGRPFLGLPAPSPRVRLQGCDGLFLTKLGIHPILSGILTMSGLYSVNLFALGSRSNLSLIGVGSVFTKVRDLAPALNREVGKTGVALLFALLAAGVLIWFFTTHLGLCIRATGNKAHVRASSINVMHQGVALLFPTCVWPFRAG
jgi:putative ABC transport system permease protein